MKDLYGSGLSERDWYVMKDAVLSASAGQKAITIPPRLEEHPASTHLSKWMESGLSRDLNRAAKALVPGDPERAWLILEKA